MTFLENQKKYNKMINDTVTPEEFIALRQARDQSLKAPRFIHPSLQVNLNPSTPSFQTLTYCCHYRLIYVAGFFHPKRNLSMTVVWRVNSSRFLCDGGNSVVCDIDVELVV
jgi:hypothetical protein